MRELRFLTVVCLGLVAGAALSQALQLSTIRLLDSTAFLQVHHVLLSGYGVATRALEIAALAFSLRRLTSPSETDGLWP